MNIEFLGTGTSDGIPVIGCSCPVCTSDNSKNKRYRSSILISHNDKKIIIDTGPEFRLQVLRAHMDRLDGVLYTHDHSDHIHGLDDVRPFTVKKQLDMFGSHDTLSEIKHSYSYIFKDTQKGGGKPRVNLHTLKHGKMFEPAGLSVMPLLVYHGRLPITGYRFGKAAYITDASSLPDETMNLLEGVEILIINALRHRPHPTHFNLEQSIDIARQLNVRQCLFTHICHDLEHDETCRNLPDNYQLAYDGLKLDV